MQLSGLQERVISAYTYSIIKRYFRKKITLSKEIF